MLPSHSQIELYDYNIALYFVREDVCSHECLSLCTKSFSCMLWLPFRLSFICYKNTVMFFNIQVQLSTIKEPYYFLHKASPQTLLGCHLPCRLVQEICVNEVKDKQVEKTGEKFRGLVFSGPFFPWMHVTIYQRNKKKLSPSHLLLPLWRLPNY